MPSRVRQLLDALRSDDFHRRGNAVRALQGLGAGALRAAPENVDALVALLDDAAPGVRISAAHAMAVLEIEVPRARDVLLDLIQHGTRPVRQDALYKLTSFSEPPASLIPELAAGLVASDPGEIYCAKTVLIAIGGPAVPAVSTILRDGSAEARRRTTAVLGGIRERYADAVMRLEFEPPHLHGAHAAYEARTRDHLSTAIRALLEALRDKERSVRVRAAFALKCGSIARIPSDVLGEYLDALLVSGHETAGFAMADALASDAPRVVAIATSRWHSLAPSRREAVLEAIRDELDAAAAARARRALEA